MEIKLDQEMIQNMIAKEVKEQVEKKMKTVGRETIKELYKQAMHEKAQEFIRSEKADLSKIMHDLIRYDKDAWKQEVTQKVSERLSYAIITALSEDDSSYDDYDDCY